MLVRSYSRREGIGCKTWASGDFFSVSAVLATECSIFMIILKLLLSPLNLHQNVSTNIAHVIQTSSFIILVSVDVSFSRSTITVFCAVKTPCLPSLGLYSRYLSFTVQVLRRKGWTKVRLPTGVHRYNYARCDRL